MALLMSALFHNTSTYIIYNFRQIPKETVSDSLYLILQKAGKRIHYFRVFEWQLFKEKSFNTSSYLSEIYNSFSILM